MKTTEHIHDFLDSFIKWVSAQEDRQDLALVGSYARGAARTDSDIDLVLRTDQPQKYLEDLKWIGRFGLVEKHQTEDYGKLISIRVWYQDGVEVEYGITVTNSPILSSKIRADNHGTTAVFSFTIPHYLIKTSDGQISIQKCIVSCPYHVYIIPIATLSPGPNTGSRSSAR